MYMCKGYTKHFSSERGTRLLSEGNVCLYMTEDIKVSNEAMERKAKVYHEVC